MHSGSVFGAYANNNVAENCLSACAFANLNGNDLLVLKAVLLGSLGVKVDMSLSGNNALSDLNLTVGANELAAGSSCNIA